MVLYRSIFFRQAVSGLSGAFNRPLSAIAGRSAPLVRDLYIFLHVSYHVTNNSSKDS
jgi:hypothetical protein